MFGRRGLRGITPLLVSATLAVGAGCAKEEPVDPNARMREIYYLSDLQGRVQPIEIYVEQALSQQTKEFTPDQLEIAREVVRRELNPKKVEQATLERLAEQPQREYVEEAIAWLKTPAVARFMQARSSAWSPSGLLEMRTYAEKLKEEPMSGERMALIERFDKATNSSGLAAETMLLAAYGVAVMHDVLKPVDERMGPAALRESMISQRPILQPIFKQTALVTVGFAFRDASDAEVEKMVEFVESEPGQWLYKTTSSTFLNALLGITANLGGIYSIALPPQEHEPAS